MKILIARYWNSFSFIGLVFAVLFFAASLTPSLLPRHFAVQGVLSGFALAIGYMVGLLLLWGWLFLELPQPKAKLETLSKRLTVIVVLLVSLLFTWQATQWQNSIRVRMEMEPVPSAEPIYCVGIAVLVALVIIVLTRGLIRLGAVISRQLNRFLPRRISAAISTVLVVALTLFIANGVVARALLDAADGFFSHADELIDEGIEQPTAAIASGGPDSLIDWETIGRRGKDFIAAGPTQKSISAQTGRVAIDPIRVYVGMRSEETVEARAKLALEELKRVRGFERSTLIIATPTGTGWLDPGAVDTVEYLHGGDTAIVTTQYSYLPSWITILIDPSRSMRSAQALFDEVYGYWKTLPKTERPRLYVQGLSLGSLGSEATPDLLTTFEDPIQGAVWSGPPFPSRQWAAIVRNRNPGSPEWLPTFRDQAMVRFTGQENALDDDKRWGPIRNVYIQHASDPMVWFSPNLAWHPPAWLKEPRGPDVSPSLRWYPIITFLQVAFDLPMATSVPIGYGHNYSPSSYIDAWIAVTQPEGWNDERIKELKTFFKSDETQ
ncbi:alpha/beta hydrolase [Novipirellula artificiosorum]|uniref:Alpha/beta-hydrolase family protein n=1 Tax=Novipirellula artificiosorum TaxID=2528016 RepID=A0A5C6E091_9BACT|nr:alpha/beta-hydrolase family protein [Novipirellula artificiosorum]TWU40746.1 hypothetical protein Poly41_15810 [Novipirellula artificiosorum]